MSLVSRRTLLRTAVSLCTVPMVVESTAHAEPVCFEGPGPVELGTAATHIQLLRMRGDIRHASRRPRVFLHLRDIRAGAAPGVGYGVHLNLSDRVPLMPGVLQVISAVRFNDTASDLSFDVTALFKRPERLGNRVIVSFVPDGTTDPGAAPRIGRLFLASA